MTPEVTTFTDEQIDELSSELSDILDEIRSFSGSYLKGMTITTETHISFYDDNGQHYHFIADDCGGLRYAYGLDNTDVMDDPLEGARVLALLKARMQS